MNKKIILLLLVISLISALSCAKSPNMSPTVQHTNTATTTPTSSPSTASPVQPTNTAMAMPTPTPTPSPSPTSDVAWSVDKSIVQVYDSDNLVATGVVVGDGSQVLTVLNYEVSTPSSMNLSVVAPGRGTYQASVQAIDSRTAATLLKIEGGALPVASTGDALAIKQGQQVTIRGWYGSGMFGKTPELSAEGLDTLHLNFYVQFPPGEIVGNITMIGQGAVVTDEKGNVLGLVGTNYNSRVLTHPDLPNSIPSVVSINSALELLSPDAAQRPWANGPLLFIFETNHGGGFTWGPSPNYDYDTVAITIKKILNNVGEPLADSDLQQSYYKIGSPGLPADSILLTVAYAWPVDLRNAEDNLLARAKWVGIQWDNDQGEANSLFYGNSDVTIDNGFVLHGDMTDLAKAVNKMISH